MPLESRPEEEAAQERQGLRRPQWLLDGVATLTDISDRALGKNCKTIEIQPALDELQRSGKIRRFQVSAGRGRPSTRIELREEAFDRLIPPWSG